MQNEFYRSWYLIYNSDFYLLCFSAIVFDLPRYLMATIAYVILILRPVRATESYKPKITVVMCLLNGADNFRRNIQALQKQTLKPFEIFVIDDGSTDLTATYARQALKEGLITHFIHHEQRCGKDASMNHGVRFAKGDFILQIDDDTLITPTGIEKLAAAFNDEQVGVASGNLPIRNKDASLWTSLQAIEYMISVEIGRSVQDLFGAVSCCSGAFMMFRKELYVLIGGHNVNSANDLELTLRIRELGYKARFVREAIAYVDAPETFEALVKQRYRWDTDILRIRLYIFNDASLYHPHETLADTLTRLDFIIFEFLQTMIFPIYIVWLFYEIRDYAIPFLMDMYLFTLLIYTVNVALAIITTNQKFNLFDAAIVLVFPLYQGVIMKIIRFASYSSEILFNATWYDDAIPEKVRRALYFPRRN